MYIRLYARPFAAVQATQAGMWDGTHRPIHAVGGQIVWFGASSGEVRKRDEYHVRHLDAR